MNEAGVETWREESDRRSKNKKGYSTSHFVSESMQEREESRAFCCLVLSRLGCHAVPPDFFRGFLFPSGPWTRAGCKGPALPDRGAGQGVEGVQLPLTVVRISSVGATDLGRKGPMGGLKGLKRGDQSLDVPIPCPNSASGAHSS